MEWKAASASAACAFDAKQSFPAGAKSSGETPQSEAKGAPLATGCASAWNGNQLTFIKKV
ncbi:hypothetical protein CD30_05700 [Ureibacillus massiliensis 4400831 = CIP 108448 = CCUG 49529]|uniref:Uncharacterized protein n=1 Tax=Ureibacillus massiliensis 4400831 = CIP 108448 = CCUG 49529 TaxID=1211035 RepID=A0A0A3J3M5_9BACL|nr:hypothetical protein CD30_05700 [Ureibacillus massiliensis 4400831 = CIP 108448 = CCUG 49529]